MKEETIMNEMTETEMTEDSSLASSEVVSDSEENEDVQEESQLTHRNPHKPETE